MKMKTTASIGIGILAGVAITMVTLQIWGTRLSATIAANAQPVLLRPLAAVYARDGKEPTLPKPSFPATLSAPHESWTVESLQGSRLVMRELRGKSVFLNFWSTSCGPCIDEMPSIERLQKSLQWGNVVFLLVTPDKRDVVDKFVSEKQFALPVFLCTPDVPADLTIRGLPTSYILDARGSIVYERAGAADWDTDEARRFIRAAARQSATSSQ
jgi:thiol-disulfide isomerase/thioredoxin